MHKANCMQSVENISIWEVFSSICPSKELVAIRRIFSLVDMINNIKFSNCPNVFEIVVVCPPRPKMPFTYVVNVYSGMSLSKGHLGSRGAKHLKIN